MNEPSSRKRPSPTALIFGYLSAGVVLFLVAAAGVAGIGPFAS